MAAKTTTARRPKLHEVPIGSLLEPLLPARETFDEDAMRDLVESIRVNGIIEPIVCVREADNYRIWAGHRRYIAAIAAELSTVPCVVWPEGSTQGVTVTVHENVYREDLNPAEQAVFYDTLLEQSCGGDVDQLCELVKQGRQYVEERLLLIRHDPDVFAALRAGRLNFSVARELNRVRSVELRKVFLDSAVKNGATARMIQEWYAKHKGFELRPLDPNSPEAAAVNGGKGSGWRIECVVCQGDHDVHDLELVYVHRHGCQVLLQKWLDNVLGVAHGKSGGEPAGALDR
jgi:ParB/RepB/Spo0J family partition protein